MPKYELKRLPLVPVSKLVNENMDSIALSREILDILNIFAKFEVMEDELKLFIYNACRETQDVGIKKILNYILSKILDIDEKQDKLIEKIVQIAKIIMNENRISNGILKSYEIYKDYVVKKRLKTDPLWGWKDENVVRTSERVRTEALSSNQSSEKKEKLAATAR